jgi:hypothetical protein
MSDAIGVGAEEMNQVLVGLGHVDEDSGDKLEGVGEGVIVELVSGLGLVDEASLGELAIAVSWPTALRALGQRFVVRYE